MENLADTTMAMRPIMPAKDFDISLRFYADLGFQSRMLTDGLAEMTLGTCSQRLRVDDRSRAPESGGELA
jgi:hypothetical protein